MSRESKPDLIVGIDFGQTCTGVSYSFPANGNDDVRWIQKWPGRAQANENKVPTVLSYGAGRSSLQEWGFQAKISAEQHRNGIREWFKTYLDPACLRARVSSNTGNDITHEDVRYWYNDFFVALYNHIKHKLSAELLGISWAAAKVEFLFSVPTTWSPQIVELFRELIGKAGFANATCMSHTITIGLTEPEAAAVHTSTTAPGMFQDGDVLVVCDAGGGTTDLSALKVTNAKSDTLAMKQLRQVDVVSGENIGSAAIDSAFEHLVLQRLKLAEGICERGIETSETAWRMTRGSHFQNTKCEHGAPDDTPRFSVPIPQLDAHYVNDEAGIEGSEMHFDQRDLQALFDEQIEKLFLLIDKQLGDLSRKMPTESVKYLILSGGLGQSPYVQRRLKTRYGSGLHTSNSAQVMHVYIAPDPQLAVCKGLVVDRLSKLRVGQSVLGWRCCRASYGLICKELYDKNNPKHKGCTTQKDPKDRELYVQNCIDWLVIKGTPVSTDQPIVHGFRRKISPGDPCRVFPTKIVVSYKDADSLPYQLDSEVQKLCEVESDLTGVDESSLKEKNKRFWSRGERYLELAYQVKVIIGPADLRFQLWFEGKILSKDNCIKVEWVPSSGPSILGTQTLLRPALIEGDSVLTKQKSSVKMQRSFYLNS